MKMLFGEVPKENSRDAVKAVNFYRMHCEKVTSLKQLVHVPQENEVNFIWTLNSFNAFTFIPFAIKEYGIINELYLSTYTVNMRIAQALLRCITAGEIENIQLFISDSLKFRMPKVVDFLEGISREQSKLQVNYSWNHSKITCMRCGVHHLVVEGSGNWSENAQYEQYVLINSKQVYDFRKENIAVL